MEDRINNVFNNLITELKKPNENLLLRNLQFHICIDVMGYISMPRDQKENGSRDYKDWFKDYLYETFLEKGRKFSKIAEPNDEELADAFWNDRSAKIHMCAHVSSRYSADGPVIKIDHYSKVFIEDLSNSSTETIDGKRVVYFISQENLVNDLTIALNKYRSFCVELDKNDYRIVRIKEVDMSLNSR